MKSNPTSIEDRIKEIIVEQLGIDSEEVTNHASFADDLNADSLDAIELVMTIEEEYEIEIPDEVVETLRTVQDVIDYVTKAKEGNK